MTEGVILKNYTTFKCGGPARYFDEPATEEEVIQDLKYAADNGIDVFVLGGGANCLISDNGFDGLVIRTSGLSDDIVIEDDEEGAVVTAGAGCKLINFAVKVANAGYEGTEFATGIPGTLGGAVFMNAGAYGGEMKDIVTAVRYIDAGGNAHEVCGDDLKLGYRTSFFARMASEGKVFVITKITARVKRGNADDITAKINEYKAKRTASQPLDVPSAGSTFKRPEGYFAGKLIDDTGLRGYSIGDSAAQVSPKHCGFVVNNGGRASADEVYKLICDVSAKVYDKFGVRLEPEVRLVGDFGKKPDVKVMSFGFKYGEPSEADMVYDVRSLKNPYWVPELRHLSGLDEPIIEYLNGFEETGEFTDGLVRSTIDKIKVISGEGKDLIIAAVGCTGGHHRSVFCAERLAAGLRGAGYEVTVCHRDILKDSSDEQ